MFRRNGTGDIISIRISQMGDSEDTMNRRVHIDALDGITDDLTRHDDVKIMANIAQHSFSLRCRENERALQIEVYRAQHSRS